MRRPDSIASAEAAPGAGRAMRPRRVERRWHWRRTMVFMVLLYALAATVQQEVAIHKLRAQEARYQNQLDRIQEESGALRQQLSELSSPAAIERAARAMGMTKPGEVVYEPVWPSR